MLAALGIAAIFGTAAPARVATLATGVLETTNTTQIRCWLGNVSTQPLTYTICSVEAFTGNVFGCRSGAVRSGKRHAADRREQRRRVLLPVHRQQQERCACDRGADELHHREYLCGGRGALNGAPRAAAERMTL